MRILRRLLALTVICAIVAVIISEIDFSSFTRPQVQPVVSRNLTQSEATRLSTFTSSDLGLSALTRKGYAAYYRSDHTGHRLMFVACGKQPGKACFETKQPTAATPHVAVMLRGEPPTDGVFEFSGFFYLLYPTTPGDKRGGLAKCELQSAAPSTVGPSGLWKDLPTHFKSIGKPPPADQEFHSFKFSDGTTWGCRVTQTG